jgi:hypothetical protein
MFWSDLKSPPPPFCLIVFMEQLMTLGFRYGDKDSAATYLASLKSEEKAAREKAQAEVDTLARCHTPKFQILECD